MWIKVTPGICCTSAFTFFGMDKSKISNSFLRFKIALSMVGFALSVLPQPKHRLFVILGVNRNNLLQSNSISGENFGSAFGPVYQGNMFVGVFYQVFASISANFSRSEKQDVFIADILDVSDDAIARRQKETEVAPD